MAHVLCGLLARLACAAQRRVHARVVQDFHVVIELVLGALRRRLFAVQIEHFVLVIRDALTCVVDQLALYVVHQMLAVQVVVYVLLVLGANQNVIARLHVTTSAIRNVTIVGHRVRCLLLLTAQVQRCSYGRFVVLLS